MTTLKITCIFILYDDWFVFITVGLKQKITVEDCFYVLADSPLKCHCDQKNGRSDFKLNGRIFSNEPK